MMRWYYRIRGGHTHVRVFMNGGKCGDLCFRNEEFAQIKGVTEAIQTLVPDRSGQGRAHARKRF